MAGVSTKNSYHCMFSLFLPPATGCPAYASRVHICCPMYMPRMCTSAALRMSRVRTSAALRMPRVCTSAAP
eukprot:6721605-Pyramimonas_sp.AAC.1